MTFFGKRNPDEEQAFRAAVGDYFRHMQPERQAIRDARGATVYVSPTAQTCSEPTCINGVAYHPDYGLVPCPVCGADVCRVCGDTGSITPEVPTDDPRFGKPVPCPANCRAARALRQQHTAALYAGARLPEGYQALTLDTFKAAVTANEHAALWRGKMLAYHATAAFIAAADDASAPFGVDYARIVEQAAGKAQPDVFSDVRNSLVFHGPHGVGKTGFAAAIVNALVPAGYVVRYIRTQDFIKAVQDRYSSDWRDNAPDDDFGDMDSGKVIDTVRKAPLLILDEFDMPDADRENKQSIVENVMRYRTGHLLPTVVTTNLDAAGLESRWGVTTLSVLRQRAHFIPVGGAPLRAVEQSFREVV